MLYALRRRANSNRRRAFDATLHSGLLTQAEAAEYLQVSERTLEKWRVQGIGPAFVKMNLRRVAYRECDLIEWVEARIRRSTCEVRQ
jgi:predicted DNA-binding transcriptional regulator AlpA